MSCFLHAQHFTAANDVSLLKLTRDFNSPIIVEPELLNIGAKMETEQLGLELVGYSTAGWA